MSELSAANLPRPFARMASEALTPVGPSTPGISAILKIDTEGCELPILRDLAEARLLINVDLLYLEYHDEADRLRIEQLLCVQNQFTLGHAQTATPHRGRNLYLARRLVQRFPSLDIDRVGPA